LVPRAGAALVAPRAVVSPGAPAIRHVAVRLRRVRLHLDGRRAKYLLSVDNRSADALESLTYAVSAGRSEGDLPPAIAVTIPGYASLTLALNLVLPRVRPARAITEVRLPSGTLVFEETPPGRRRWFGKAATLALALAVVLFLASGLARPSVTALAAPGDVMASRPFAVAYALARAGGADYTVVSTNGFEAARGDLDADDGSFDVVLPFAAQPEAYVIRVVAHSRLGDAARSIRVLAEPDPVPVPIPIAPEAAAPLAAHPSRPPGRRFAIDRLALKADTVEGGKPVTVYYRVSSAEGMVRLIDQYGTVRAEALVGRRGNSILLAPFVDTNQDFRVVLHASRGTAQAEKSVTLRVTKAASIDDIIAAARREGSGPIALVDKTVAPGDPIQIGIVQYEPGLRVALVDPQGQEIAASTVVDDQNEVTLTAPAVAGPAVYTVVATYVNGIGQETVIRNVTIGGNAPHPAP
jgi:hypothetical protein